MDWIDAHAHLPVDVEGLELPVVRVVNICVDHADLGGLAAQRQWYRGLLEKDRRRWSWVTSFSLTGFGTTGWAERAIAQLEGDIAAGACGVKVWKNVGMELRDADGAWVFLDDPRFQPVLTWLEKRDVPLLTHQAEPIQAWLPLDERNPHFGYFSSVRHWYFHGRNDVPTHGQILAARDAVIARHRRLRVIGLHLGSQEHDLPAVSERLERYPNYCIDTAGRLGDLAVACERDRSGLIAFLQRWSGRVIWGTDWVMGKTASAMSLEERGRFHGELLATYERERRFFASTEELTIAGRKVRGLGLTGPVLEALVRGTALRSYG